MDITKLKSFARVRTLQSCQSLAAVYTESGKAEVLIYDSSTAHWLHPISREEVGALSYALGERIECIEVINSTPIHTTT